MLERKCKEEKVKYEIIKDLGSGLNFRKKGLKRLIQLIISSKLDRIYITHKNRLLRFGSELVISIAREFGTEVIIMEEEEKTFERN